MLGAHCSSVLFALASSVLSSKQTVRMRRVKSSRSHRFGLSFLFPSCSSRVCEAGSRVSLSSGTPELAGWGEEEGAAGQVRGGTNSVQPVGRRTLRGEEILICRRLNPRFSVHIKQTSRERKRERSNEVGSPLHICSACSMTALRCQNVRKRNNDIIRQGARLGGLSSKYARLS